MPTLSASPCREWNISVILRRDTFSSVRVRGHVRQTVCRQLCGIGARELLSDVRERLARSVEFLQLVLREAELQHRIRCLARAGPFVQDRAEGRAGAVEIPRHVVGLAE